MHKFFRTNVYRNVFDNGSPYKHYKFLTLCLHAKMAVKTVIRPVATDKSYITIGSETRKFAIKQFDGAVLKRLFNHNRRKQSHEPIRIPSSRQVSRWRHLTTTSTIQFVFLFLCKFCISSGIKIRVALISMRQAKPEGFRYL